MLETIGHSHMSPTSDLYAHVAPAMLVDAADALERAMNLASSRIFVTRRDPFRGQNTKRKRGEDAAHSQFPVLTYCVDW
jgi:hypothetical protein